MNTELKKVLVIDPVVDCEESFQATEIVYKSGVNKSIFKYTADSNSDQNWIWNNITPPSLTTCVLRTLRVQYTILVVNVITTASIATSPRFNAIGNGGAINAGGSENAFFGVVPRACPVASAATAIELRLNGSSTSTSNNDYACVYPHLASNEDKALWSSEFPMQKDDSALYTSPVASGPVTFDNRSPFAAYGSNVVIPSRASYVWALVDTVVSGTNTVNTYQLQITEQLMISPMVWGEMINKSMGLTNINNITLNIRLADVNRMISANVLDVSGTNNLYVSTTKSLSVVANGGTVACNANNEFVVPTLLIEYITQDPILSARQPQTVVYDYSQIQPFITPVGIYKNTTTTESAVTMQSLRLASIPAKFYFYGRPSKSALNTKLLLQTTPDTFLRIKNLSLNFNNRINLFATYSEVDLYNMSVKNGLKDSYNEWKYNTGSIVIVDVARDIGLEPDEDSGQANKYSTLQVTATLSASPLAYAAQTGNINYDFYTLVEQPGKCFITPSECQYVLTGPSSAEVLQLTSNLDNKVDHTELEGKSIGGGAFNKGKLFKSGLKHRSGGSMSNSMEKVNNLMHSVGLGVAGGSMAKKHSRVY